ncbi:YveK family protein [Ureibacillus acetophenoni]
MQESFSIMDILKFIKKRLLLIISSMIISTVTAVIISYFFLPTIYLAQTQLLVNQKDGDSSMLSWNQIEMELQLIQTYNIIVKTPTILNKVIEQVNLDLTANQLAEKISVSNESNSKIVNISVEDEHPELAVNIANKIAEVFKDEIPNLMKVDNINILTYATLAKDPTPIKPNKTLNVVIASLVGLMIGIGLSLIFELFNTTVRDEDDLIGIFEFPIMGVVSPFSTELNKKSKYRQGVGGKVEKKE